MRKAKRLENLIAPLICAGVPLVCIPGLEWAAVSSWGSEVFLWVELVFVPLILCAAVVFALSLIWLVFSSARRYAFVSLFCGVAYVLGFFIAVQIGENVRMHALAKLAQRSTPMLNAVDAYDRKYGHPPVSLKALVPEFMPSIPSTGMAAYPKWEYCAADRGAFSNGNRWELYINTPSGGINWDRFMYWPRHNYPQYAYGGWVERVETWAYVHE